MLCKYTFHVYNSEILFYTRAILIATLRNIYHLYRYVLSRSPTEIQRSVSTRSKRISARRKMDRLAIVNVNFVNLEHTHAETNRVDEEGPDLPTLHSCTSSPRSPFEQRFASIFTTAWNVRCA